jgi:hypothetical protein
MGRTACTEPQCLYKGDLYLYPFFTSVNTDDVPVKIQTRHHLNTKPERYSYIIFFHKVQLVSLSILEPNTNPAL